MRLELPDSHCGSSREADQQYWWAVECNVAVTDWLKIVRSLSRVWRVHFKWFFILCSFLQRTQCSHCKRCISYSNSVCLSVHLSVTRRYCVKTTAHSTVQFALLDSKMCRFVETKKYSVRDRKRSSITLNKNSARAFQRAIHQGSMAPLTSTKWGSKCLDLSSFGRLNLVEGLTTWPAMYDHWPKSKGQRSRSRNISAAITL